MIHRISGFLKHDRHLVVILLLVTLLVVGSSNAHAYTVEWAVQGRGESILKNPQIAVDSLGNIYVSGSYGTERYLLPGSSGKVTSNVEKTNETTLTNKTTQDYLSKYNSNGELIWVKSSDDSFEKIAVDEAGNLYAMGLFIIKEHQKRFSTSVDRVYGLLLVKFSTNGNRVWEKRVVSDGIPGNYSSGLTDSEFGDLNGTKFVVDGMGNLYVTGHFYGGAIFGKDEPNETNFDLYSSAYVAKYNADGELVWVKTRNNNIDTIAVDDTGSYYLVHQSARRQFFSRRRLHLDKYTANGKRIWSKQVLIPACDNECTRRNGHFIGYPGIHVSKILVDGSESVYMAGYFFNSVTFEPGEMGETTLLNKYAEGSYYIAKYTAVDGTFIRVTRPANHHVIKTGFDIDNAGNVFFSGVTDLHGAVTPRSGRSQ
ncbi:MAG TPA: hypothetical protein ENJ32_07110 [Crenotrichaceae bacterium]|nr:hypothetical protein [Crenotrichaceae bacterium]